MTDRKSSNLPVPIRHASRLVGIAAMKSTLRFGLLMLLTAISCVPVFAAPPPAASRSLDLDAATIADLNAAFAEGSLTSERLVQMYQARIAAYDKQGPRVNSVIMLNPKALETARALDEERARKGPRSSLHGIPMVVKDNFNTYDLPTTAGSLLLEGWVPPNDAFVVARLRAAGAVILAKVNMTEFAYGEEFSSLGGQTRNPHDPTRVPSGSSGGTGAAVAATFASFGLGTDTNGSIRDPARVNGIVGLRPSMGLLSRSGIIPLALSFDTPGPMARNVYDVALALGAMTGVDAGDPVTRTGVGRYPPDYTKGLKRDALKGARIGIARQYMGADGEVDWLTEASLAAMRKAGATIVEVEFPQWLVDSGDSFDRDIYRPEFVAQIADYLSATGPQYPKNIAEMIERSRAIIAPRADGAGPSIGRWRMFEREAAAPGLDDYRYKVARDQGLPLVRAAIDGLIAQQRLDAIVYPTSPWQPALIVRTPGASSGSHAIPILLSSLSGFPELSVPAGFTSSGLPVGLSLLGPAFSEQKLLNLGYAFEQATHARRLPKYTPALPDQVIARP